MKPLILAALIIATGSLVVIAASLYTRVSERPPAAQRGFFMTNAAQIEGLYTQVDIKDSMAVFSYLFTRLPDSVTVYPSENYFYMKFTLAGRPYDAALMLFPNDRRKGLARFGYLERLEDKTRGALLPMTGGWADLDTSCGMLVEKVDSLRYRLTFNGKSVVFTMYVDSNLRPRKVRLTPDEVYVGPSFDESGIQFFLLFNRAEKKLYWVLNDEGFVPDEFVHFGKDIVIGVRTGFAFYIDTANNRHIMIGVEGLNVMQNNWFDGPFDQMPDNYVDAGLLSVKPYLAQAYGIADSLIDSFGVFVRTPTSRIPVAPYMVYFDTTQLQFVDTLHSMGLTGSKFYAALTRQQYMVPTRYKRSPAPPRKPAADSSGGNTGGRDIGPRSPHIALPEERTVR